MVAAFRQQPVDQDSVDAFGGEHRVGDALRRVLIVVEPGGPEGEVEIGDDRRLVGDGGERPGEIVGDGRGADPALRADDRDDSSERLCARRPEEVRDGLNEIDDLVGRREILADAPRDQLAVERDVVGPSEDDHLRPRIAVLGELVELGEQDATCRRAPRSR